MKLLYLEWEDHSSYHTGWKNKDFYADNAPVLIKSTGFLLTENDKALTILSHWDEKNDAAQGDMTILKSCIRKRKVIKL